ncbi:lamin tail domain-containing protein [Haloarchaeobius sp. DFWS5]|uniref:lamin tail domain-containing protein n=1 Tax=Haloarchaeobius sp. DFWS5 TaxID=3446114 RepID=UPI003EB6E8AC
MPKTEKEHEQVHHSSLALDEIHDDPMGRDRKHLDEEYVIFENTGTTPLDLSGWTVENEAGDEYQFPDGTELAAGAHLTLHSGWGTDTAAEHYWCSDDPVWGNLGDTIFVRDAAGVLRLRESFDE